MKEVKLAFEDITRVKILESCSSVVAIIFYQLVVQVDVNVDRLMLLVLLTKIVVQAIFSFSNDWLQWRRRSIHLHSKVLKIVKHFMNEIGWLIFDGLAFKLQFCCF